MVRNQHGNWINFTTAVFLMDDEIREQIHNEFAPCTEQEFFDAYCAAHATAYGEEFELNRLNPEY